MSTANMARWAHLHRGYGPGRVMKGAHRRSARRDPVIAAALISAVAIVVAAVVTPVVTKMISPSPPPSVIVTGPARPDLPSQPGVVPAWPPSGVHCKGHAPGSWSRRVPRIGGPIHAGRRSPASWRRSRRTARWPRWIRSSTRWSTHRPHSPTRRTHGLATSAQRDGWATRPTSRSVVGVNQRTTGWRQRSVSLFRGGFGVVRSAS